MLLIRSHFRLQTGLVVSVTMAAVLPAVPSLGALPPDSASTQPSNPEPAQASADVVQAGRVFVLTGITGASRRTKHLSQMIGRYARANEERLSVEVIDWPRFDVGDTRPSMISLLEEDELNRTRARLVAERIREARRVDPDTNFFLLAKSAGGLMAILTCQSTDSSGVPLLADGTFERIVLVSVSFPEDRDVSVLHAKSKNGVFSYFSARDPVLLAAQALSGEKPAGMVGLAQNKNAKTWQLEYSKAEGLDNDGGHWGSFREQYFGLYIMPLLRPSESTIPAGWRRGE